MSFLDFPQDDPESNYSGPSAKQLIYAEKAERHLKALRAALQRLTVPQQRAVIGKIRNELVGGVFRKDPLKLHPRQT